MIPVPKRIDPEQETRDQLLEARRLAANTLRFLDDAERRFVTRDLVEGFLSQASDYAQKTIVAIENVKKMMSSNDRTKA
jgi:hypothetical protein